MRRNNFCHGNFFTAVQKRKSSAAFLARGDFRHSVRGRSGRSFAILVVSTSKNSIPGMGMFVLFWGYAISVCLVENVLGSASDPTVADCGVDMENAPRLTLQSSCGETKGPQEYNDLFDGG